MGWVRTHREGLFVGLLLGLPIGIGIGVVAAIIASVAGWIDQDGMDKLIFGSVGVGPLVGMAAAVVHQTRRTRPRTELEILISRNRRLRRAERRDRWRDWWDDVVPFAVLRMLGGAAVLAYSVTGVVAVMLLLGADDPRLVPVGVVVGLVLGVPLIVLAARFSRGGVSGDGGSGGADDSFFDGGGGE